MIELDMPFSIPNILPCDRTVEDCFSGPPLAALDRRDIGLISRNVFEAML